MKLASIFFLALTMQVSAAASSQTVTYSGNNIGFKKLLNVIKTQTDYVFFYDSAIAKDAKPVSLNVINEPLEKVLDKAFAGADFTYVIQGKTISLVANPKKSVVLAQQTTTITGTVFNEMNEKLIGASILEKGTQNGTMTDALGNFKMTVSGNNPTLLVSYIGYEDLEYNITSPDNMKIVMKEAVTNMQEIVIIGYGQQTRDKVTGSVASIKSKEIEQLATGVVGFDKALGGLAQGVQVSQNSGRPGDPIRINIRGLTSPLSGSLNQPLFVIDGVIFNVDALSGVNPLLAINPSDIEKIDVLKDVAATAIYGSRGANGVVIVSTKRGKKNQRSRVDLSFSSTFATPVNTLKALNAGQYKTFYNTLVKNSVDGLNDGTLESYNDYDLMNIANIDIDYSTFQYTFDGMRDDYFGTANTDWNKEIFRKLAVTNQTNFTLSGGNEKTNHSFSISAIDQEGLTVKDEFDQYNMRFAIDSKLNDKFTFGATANVSHTKSTSGEAIDFNIYNINTANVVARPDLPIYNADGSFYDQPDYTYGFETFEPNPLAKLSNKYQSRTYNFIGNTYAEFTPIKDLVLRADINAAVFYNTTSLFVPKYTLTNFGAPNESSLVTNDGLNSNVTTNITAKYNFKIAKDHDFNALVGTAWDRTKLESSAHFYQGFPDDDILTNVNSASTVVGSNSGKSENGINSLFSRLSYSYKDLYNFTANYRIDGSSKFGPEFKRGSFPSISVSWNASNEEFLKNVEQLNVLKFRASAGKVGSANTTSFNYLPFFDVNGTTSYGGQPGVIPSNTLSNVRIQWESTKELNFGLDFKMFSHRLSGSIDIYDRLTTEALAPTPIPYELGPLLYFSNLMDVSNKGIEINLGGDLVRTEDFNWNVNINWASNKNKLEKLNGANINQFNLDYYVEGQPIGTIKGYRVEKIFQDQTEIDDLNANSPNGFYSSQYAGVGDYKFVDTNGDGEITTADRQIIGNVQPDFFGGFSNTFTYKNISLAAFFQFSVGAEAIWDAVPSGVYNSLGQNKLAEYGLNTWTAENPNAKYAKAVYTDPAGNSRISDKYLFDTSYLRLKNIQLTYNFDKNLIERLQLSRASIFVAASNMLTFTKYPGLDPETFSDSGGITGQANNLDPYPLAKSVSVGVQLQF